MVITYLILLLLTQTINKTYSQIINNNTPPKEIQTGGKPLHGIAYDDTTALVIIEKTAYTLTQDGKTTEFPSIPTDPTSSYSAGLYRIDDDHYATICRHTLITIHNKTDDVIFNSTITDYDKYYPCVMKKINSSNYLILSMNSNYIGTMHTISNTWTVISSYVIKDTKQKKIIIGRSNAFPPYDIEYINTTLLLFTYRYYLDPANSNMINIIGITHDAVQTTNTLSLNSSYAQSRLFRFNDATVLLLAIKDNKIAINTVDYTTDPITLNDERVIDISLSSIYSYTTKIQDNIIELFCGSSSDGQSFIQYDYTLKETITHIKYTNPLTGNRYYPNIIILEPSKTKLLLFNIEYNRKYYMIIPKCHARTFDVNVNVLVSHFGILSMNSILFYNIDSKKNPPTLNDKEIVNNTNDPLTSTDYIKFNTPSICKYEYSINQQTDDKCEIIIEGCTLCDIENCATCEENPSKCTSCLSDYYSYQEKTNGIIIGCYKPCKDAPAPLILFQDEDSKKCYKNCSEINKKNDLETNACVTDCPSGIEYNLLLNICGSKCDCLHHLISITSIGEVYDLTLCVVNSISECKECQLVGYNKTNTCVKQCPKGLIPNPSQSYCISEDGYLDDLLDNENKYIDDIVNKHPVINTDNETNIYYKSPNGSDILDKYPNISKVDLTECEKTLRRVYHIPDTEYLIIKITNNKTDDRLTNGVNYTVFTQRGVELDINYCNDVPVTNPFNNKTSEIYEEAKKMKDDYGVDIFNALDPFFNDKCFKFTSKNGTDVILTDRQKDILKSPLKVCESHCKYISADYITNEVKCNCTNKEQTPPVSKYKPILWNFNYQVALCYNLVFDSDIFTLYNIGNIVGIVLSGLSVFTYFYLLFQRTKPLTAMMNEQKIVLQGTQMVRISNPPRRMKESEPVQYNTMISPVQRNQMIQSVIRSNITRTVRLNDIPEEHDISEEDDQRQQNNDASGVNREVEKKEYTNDELDAMVFKEAVKNDKRNIFILYLVYLKNTHPIIVTFFDGNNGSLRSLKILLFIFSIMIDYSVSAFFYTDGYISQTYKRNAPNSVFDTLLVSIYSYLCGFLLNYGFGKLSSYDSMMKKQFKIQLLTDFIANEKKLLRNYRLKLTLLIFLHLSFCCLFWYYMTAFCAVYQNSQKEWVMSGLTGTGMAMVMPFALSMVFALIRQAALGYKSTCLFLIVRIIAKLI